MHGSSRLVGTGPLVAALMVVLALTVAATALAVYHGTWDHAVDGSPAQMIGFAH